MLVEILRIFNLWCSTMQRELSCVWMRCSMRTRFADAVQHADAFFVIRAISNGDALETT